MASGPVLGRPRSGFLTTALGTSWITLRYQGTSLKSCSTKGNTPNVCLHTLASGDKSSPYLAGSHNLEGLQCFSGASVSEDLGYDDLGAFSTHTTQSKANMSGTNPPTSAGGPQSAAASVRPTQSLKRSVQAAFDGRILIFHAYVKLHWLHSPWIVSLQLVSDLILRLLDPLEWAYSFIIPCRISVSPFIHFSFTELFSSCP